jgi:hypothetical protein
MGSSKATAPPQQPYRDEPDYAETASMSSAVLLDDVESFPDEELPAYEDTPSEAPLAPAGRAPTSHQVFFHGAYSSAVLPKF